MAPAGANLTKSPGEQFVSNFISLAWSVLHFLHSTGSLTDRVVYLAITVGCVLSTDRALRGACDCAGVYGTGLTSLVADSTALQPCSAQLAVALSLAVTHAISVDFFFFKY